MNGPRVYQFADGGTILADQPVAEAERALDEAASHAYIEKLRAEFYAAVENHCTHFGFNTHTGEFTA